ncbi:ParB/RepB/Spo0J family partition protein [Nocardia neocaledoniensis]|uniref:ParB/RepB/Spo0J family partition protein n=1 Tax=Nocardia neocaledoniensis TaxID=236511 RepID=UPI002455F19E|nr:ParB/RepB/Spo0J family partition protein [Nocardia neocaledoniensis]
MSTTTIEPDTSADLDQESSPGTDATLTVLAPLPAPAEAVSMDPADLVIGHNVRPEDQIDLDAHPKEVESIRRFGVRDPILAQRGPDGHVVVVDGQVRALIARTLGLARVPVYVEATDRSIDDPERLIERALDQINLNDRRIELTDSARVAGVAYMLDLGATATRIAEGLQIDTARVRKAGKIGRSSTARNLVDSSAFSLDQLEVIAGYEQLGDHAAVEKLSAVRWNFDYEAEMIAADRARRRDRLTAALPFAAAGHPILEAESVEVDLDTYIPVDDLVDTNAEPVSPEAIDAEPGRWAVAMDLIEDAELFDPATDEVIDPDTVDFDADTPGTEPADGLRSAAGLVYRDVWMPSYYLPVDQLDAAGLHRRDPDTSGDRTEGGEGGGEGDGGDRARVAAEQAAADSARKREERRRVIELNKRGAAAKKRRLEFLARVLTLRTPPPGSAELVATSLARDTTLLGGTRARTLALTLFNANNSTNLTDTATSAVAGRAWVITLGLVLAAHESTLDKDCWRTHAWQGNAVSGYLHFLAAVGEHLAGRGRASDRNEQFRLVDVELAAAGDLDYRTIPLDQNSTTVPAMDERGTVDDNDPLEEEQLAHAA